MKFCIFFTLALAAAANSSHGASSIVFNNPFFGNVSEGFADSSGTPQNGLAFGIVIDTSGNGFLTQYESGFNLERGTLINLSTNLGASTDDQLWLSAGLSADDVFTNDTSGFTEFDFETTGGTGGLLGGISGIPASAANKNFAIIWFDSSQTVGATSTVPDGRKFGLLSDPTFVLAGDNTLNTIYDAPFAGADDPRPATFGVFAVPEPSTALLGLLGLAGLLRRKR